MVYTSFGEVYTIFLLIIISEKEEINMISTKTSAINSLIERETALINQYEQYLKTLETVTLHGPIKELIEKHNNHISTLQKLLRR
jgi:rubrerythrin